MKKYHSLGKEIHELDLDEFKTVLRGFSNNPTGLISIAAYQGRALVHLAEIGLAQVLKEMARIDKKIGRIHASSVQEVKIKKPRKKKIN